MRKKIRVEDFVYNSENDTTHVRTAIMIFRPLLQIKLLKDAACIGLSAVFFRESAHSTCL